MTPDQYVKDAIRTESPVSEIQANPEFLSHVIEAIVALSSILDQVKKNAFYGKKFDGIKISGALHVAGVAVEQMRNSIVDHGLLGGLHPVERKELVPINARLFHSVIGIATESSELLEALKLDGTPMDTVNMLEEFGDLNWYQAIGIDQAGGSFEQVLERNIAKLKARFPNKFTSEDAINRDLTKERAILEDIHTN